MLMNCASANRRGAVQEKVVYVFDVACLQETRACPNRPLVFQDFAVIQRQQGHGMAIAVRRDLSKTISSLILNRWSTSSRELQDSRIEKPDERHKSLILINAYNSPFHKHHRGKFGFPWGLLLFVGCLTSQQHASVSQGRVCSDTFTCCHTEIEFADQTFHLTQSQYTDTAPTSPSTDPITPGAWQGSHWSTNF